MVGGGGGGGGGARTWGPCLTLRVLSCLFACALLCSLVLSCVLSPVSRRGPSLPAGGLRVGVVDWWCGGFQIVDAVGVD